MPDPIQAEVTEGISKEELEIRLEEIDERVSSKVGLDTMNRPPTSRDFQEGIGPLVLSNSSIRGGKVSQVWLNTKHGEGTRATQKDVRVIPAVQVLNRGWDCRDFNSGGEAFPNGGTNTPDTITITHNWENTALEYVLEIRGAAMGGAHGTNWTRFLLDKWTGGVWFDIIVYHSSSNSIVIHREASGGVSGGHYATHYRLLLWPAPLME